MSVPWNPQYVPPAANPDLIQQVTSAIEGAVSGATEVATSMGSTVAGQVAGQAAAQAVQDVGQVAQATEQVVEKTVVNPTVAGVPPTGANTPAVVTNWITDVEKQAATQAEAAYQAVLPMIQGKIVKATTDALQAELSKSLGQPQVASLPSGSDLKKLDAWERAGRTFFMGLVTVILASIIQVIGDSASSGTVNFFTVDGWKSVAVLGGGAVVTSIFSYLYRYLKEPNGAAINSSAKG